MAGKFPTKQKMREAGLLNSHRIAYLFPEQKVWLTASVLGGVYVHGIGFKTDPAGHWHNYGSKCFFVLNRKDLLRNLAQAQAWAEERYGKREWVRDPFGGWHDARIVPLVIAKVKALTEKEGQAK